MKIVCVTVLIALIAEMYPGTMRSVAAFAAWAARREYAGDPERADQRAEEWQAMIRDWLALAGLVIVLTFALSYLTRSAARRSKSMLRRRRDAAKGKEEQEQRSPRNTRIVISLFDGIARLRYGLGFSESSSQEGSVWQALSYPRFRWYFAGSAVSNFGTWLQNGAQVVLAFQLTHSVAWVGILAGAQFLFPLVLGPWAISVVQRLGNWHTLVFAQYLSMSISATLTVLQFCHLLSIRGLAIGALAMGFCFTFALPAQSVTVPSLVSPTETKRALALDSVSYNLGRALAPIFSVALFLTVGFSWIFALNAASFAFFAAVLLRLKRHDARAEIHRPSAGNGFRMAWHDRRILILLLMVAAVTVASDPIMVLGPKVAHTLGASADWSDLFIAALGTGHVLGTLRPTRSEASIRRGAVALGLLSAAMMVFILSPWLWLSIFSAATAGLATLLAGTILRTLLLNLADGPARQAAVMAAWAVAWAGSKPIASFIDGTFAGVVGFRLTGLLLALPALAPVVVLSLRPSFGKRLVHHANFDPAN